MKSKYLFSLMLLSFCAIGAKEVKSMVNNTLKRPYSSTNNNNKPVNKIADMLNLNSLHYFENGKIITSVSDPTSDKIIIVEVDPLTNKHSTIKLPKVENVIVKQTLDYDNYT